MPAWRKTAVVHFELPSGADEGSLPLAVEREFAVTLSIDGRSFPAHSFQSPINDEQWRDFLRQLRTCNGTDPNTGDRPSQKGNRDSAAIRALGRKLFQSLAQLSPALSDFLSATGSPRRLVIETTRPELHLLPWAALCDDAGHFLAAGDLSVVHCWQDFTSQPRSTGSRLRLLKVLGQDTNQRTLQALEALQSTPELEQRDISATFQTGASGDILHLEKHGDAVQNTTGGLDPTTLAANFSDLSLALLWSCFSAAANSWGESPALNLHRAGVTLVLSFLAELNNDDAGSISAAFYADVFGPAASLDPESALVRIRAAKAASELGWANWASMTVFLAQPVDLSALPLNGPRVPESAWIPAPADASGDAAALDPFWTQVAAQVRRLQPGSRTVIDPASIAPNPSLISYDKIPAAAFRSWRGNVIRISEALDATPDAATLLALGLPAPEDMASQHHGPHSLHFTDPADRLQWFFSQIARFGSPLIVWTDAAPRHAKFLDIAQPPSSLTFLLLAERPLEKPTLMELVDENRLDEAFEACKCLPATCSDSELAAAYWACARQEHLSDALPFLARISSPQERLLLMGNYVSRDPETPLPPALVQAIPGIAPGDEPVRPEDFYRLAMSPPDSASAPAGALLRETGRARHELAFACRERGQKETAEMLMHQALREIEESGEDPAVRRDSRWYFALSATLRDLADLLAEAPERVDDASWFLRRAMAIQVFHGMRLELAYSTATAARIALSSRHNSQAIDHAVDSANLFETCRNWRGWLDAIAILFDALAETRETVRILSLADLVDDKLQVSSLVPDRRQPAVQGEDRLTRCRRNLVWQRARAHWIAGSLPEATRELTALAESAPEALADPRIARLWNFLRITPVTPPAQN